MLPNKERNMPVFNVDFVPAYLFLLHALNMVDAFISNHVFYCTHLPTVKRTLCS